MTDEQWKEFYPYLTPDECGRQMNYEFMLKVLEFRLRLNSRMHIISGFDNSGHEKGSYHYIGEAIDWWADLSPRLTMRLIDESGLFNGVGFYPWGAHRSFHTDNRPRERYQRWVSPSKGKYIYLLEGS